MIQSLNFPLSAASLRPYGSWETLGRKVRALGLDGLELIADPWDPPPAIPAELVAGYHLMFYPDWLDFYRGDEAALLRKFGSWETVERIYVHQIYVIIKVFQERGKEQGSIE